MIFCHNGYFNLLQSSIKLKHSDLMAKAFSRQNIVSALIFNSDFLFKK